MRKILSSAVFFFVAFFLFVKPGIAAALRATPTKAQQEAQKAKSAEEYGQDYDVSAPSESTEIQLSREQILIVQAALNNAGHQCQRSGIMGKKTWRALRRFQAEQGLPVTGKIDIQTLKVLGIYNQIIKNKK
jgi:peptidoglycan hydrolase-like protein with peptidoglycan-binding domain